MTWHMKPRRSAIKEKLKTKKELQMLSRTLTFCTLRLSIINSFWVFINSLQVVMNCLILLQNVRVCICVESTDMLETYKHTAMLKH